MKPTQLALAVFCLVTVEAPMVIAADSTAADPSADGRVVRSVHEILGSLDAPNGSGAAMTSQSKISVETSTDKTTASLDLAGVVTGRKDQFINLALTVKAPFDSTKSDVADLGTLSGLTAGTQAHFSFEWSRWPGMTSNIISNVSEYYTHGQIAAALANLYGKYPWIDTSSGPGTPSGQPSIREAVVAAKLDPTELSAIQDEDSYWAVLAQLNKAIDAYNKGDGKAPVSGKPLPRVPAVADFQKAVGNVHSRYYAFAIQNAPKFVPAVALTLDGNNQNFSYVLSSNPGKIIKDSKRGYAFGFVVSGLWPRGGALASIGYSIAHSYTGQPAVQICTPIGSTNSMECVSGAIGSPKSEVDHLITGQLRWRLGSIAISPRVEYSTQQSSAGISLPIYMVADKTKLLNGGIALGWTQSNRFGVALFVGKPFSFD